MSSVSPISSIGSNLPSSSSTGSNPNEQLAQGMQALSTAIQSGNTTAATTAITAIQNALTASNPDSVVTANSLQLQGDLSTMSQALGSGNSTAINSAFMALEKDLTAPAKPASYAASAATPAYVLSLLSTLPDSNSNSSSATPDVGSNLLLTLSAQETANNTAKMNLYS
jgi:hypothetical protein